MKTSGQVDREGDKFEQFFLSTYPKVKSFALKILKSEKDAEDIAQDVFVKLWANPEIWESLEHMDSYVYKMTRNHVFNFLKHKYLETNYQEQAAKTDSSLQATHIYENLYAKETELLSKLIINNMPDQRKKVFQMSRDQEMTNQEIADILDLSVRTVERHIYLAIKELKEKLL